MLKPSKLPKLATSRFISGPNDTLAAADIYEISNNAIRSRAQAENNQGISPLIEAIRIPYEQINNVNPIADGGLDQLLGDVKNRAVDYLDTLIPGAGAGIGMLDELKLPTSKRGGIGSLDLLSFDGSMSLGNTGFSIPKEQMSSAVALNSVLNDLGIRNGVEGLIRNTVSDAIAETLVYTALGNKLIDAGMGPLIGEVINMTSDAAVKKAVALGVIPKVINPRNTRYPNTKEINNDTEGYIYRPVYTNGPNIREPVRTKKPLPIGTIDPSVYDDSIKVGNGVTVGETIQQRAIWGTGEDFSDAFETDGNKVSSKTRNTQEKDNSPGYRDSTLNTITHDNDPKGTGMDLDTLILVSHFVSPGEILALYPNIFRIMLQTYRFPQVTNIDFKKEYEKLIGYMDSLDPKWDKGSRFDGISNLAPLSRASRDSVHLLTTYIGSRFTVEALIAKSYVRSDIPGLIRYQYPDLIF